jgi:hypothetical protein
VNNITLQGGLLGDWAGAHAAAAAGAVAALAESAILSFSFVVLQVSCAIPCAAAASPQLSCLLDLRVASDDAKQPASSKQAALKHPRYHHLVLLIIRRVLLQRLLQLQKRRCSIIAAIFLHPAPTHAFAQGVLHSRTGRGVSEHNVRRPRLKAWGALLRAAAAILGLELRFTPAQRTVRGTLKQKGAVGVRKIVAKRLRRRAEANNRTHMELTLRVVAEIPPARLPHHHTALPHSPPHSSVLLLRPLHLRLHCCLLQRCWPDRDSTGIVCINIQRSQFSHIVPTDINTSNDK